MNTCVHVHHQIVNQPTLHFSRLCMYVYLLLFEAAEYRYNFCYDSSSHHYMEVEPKDFILCTSDERVFYVKL